MSSFGLVIIILILSAAASAQTIDDVFDTNVVKEIRLAVDPNDWQTFLANPGSNTYYPADFQWGTLTVRHIGIRQRGGSTRNGIKPSIRLDFNRYESSQTFLSLKSLGLKNNEQDASQIKDRIVMEVFARLGVPVPRDVSATVYVNGDYYGLFSVVEPVDKDFLQRAFKENDGYLYSYNDTTNYHFEYLGADPSLYVPRFFEPQTHTNNPKADQIVAMIRTMNTASDADFAKAMAPYINLSFFMKELAIEDFMAETDGILTGMNNFDMYRLLSGVSQIIPNDKDLTFGGPPTNPNRPQSPLLGNAGKNVLIRRALNVPEARDSYFNTIMALRQLSGAGGWLETEIVRIYSQIRSAVLADTKKQCFTGAISAPCANSQFEAEIAADLQFARQRGDFVQSQVAQLSQRQVYAFNERGGMLVTTSSTSSSIASMASMLAGYGLIDPDISTPRPDAVAIFSYRQGGVVVSETSVPASAAIRHGTIYVDVASNGARTGVAIANPGPNNATLTFSFTDANGNAFGQNTLVVNAGTQIAKFVDQAPFNSGVVKAVLTFDSTDPVFVTALRGLTNERSDFILSTLPVVDSSVVMSTLVIPHLADGGGWTTHVVLINPSTDTMRGSLQFVDQQTHAVTNTVNYTIPPQSYFRFQTAGTASSTQSGFVRIIPANNGTTPAAFGIFSFRQNGVTVSEAALTAVPGSTAYRVYAENGSAIQTGIAIANLSSDPITVNLEATTLTGEPAGLSGALTIPGNDRLRHSSRRFRVLRASTPHSRVC